MSRTETFNDLKESDDFIIRPTQKSIQKGDSIACLVQWNYSAGKPRYRGILKGSVNAVVADKGVKPSQIDWDLGSSTYAAVDADGNEGDVKTVETGFPGFDVIETIFNGEDKVFPSTGSKKAKYVDRVVYKTKDILKSPPAVEKEVPTDEKKEDEKEVIDEQAKEASEEAEAAEKTVDEVKKDKSADPDDVKEKEEYARSARAHAEKLMEKAKKVHKDDRFYTEFKTQTGFSDEFIKVMDKNHAGWFTSWRKVVSDAKNHVHYVDGRTLYWGIKFEDMYYFGREIAKSLSILQLSAADAGGDIKPGWVFPSSVRFNTRRNAAGKKDGETKTSSETIPKSNVESGIQSLRDQLAALTLRLELSGAVKKDNFSALPAHVHIEALRSKIKRTGEMIERNLAAMRRVYV